MSSPPRPNPVRFPLLLLGIFTLLAALWAGMLRIGLTLPPLTPTLSGGHGPLMIAGFLGTVIGLERAVAMGRAWMFAAPALAALGGLLIIFGAPPVAGALSITLSSVVLILLFIQIVRLQPALFNYVLTLAAAVWLGGNLFWLFGTPITHVVPAWAGFLVLTIAGERLELTRLLRISRAGTAALLIVLAVVVAGAFIAPGNYSLGWRVTGLGLAAVSLWLLQYDIARRTVRGAGADPLHRALHAAGLLLAAGGRPHRALARLHLRRRLRRGAARALPRLCLQHDLRPRAGDLPGGAGDAHGVHPLVLQPPDPAAPLPAAAGRARGCWSGCPDASGRSS